jgi:hypothetical protein
MTKSVPRIIISGVAGFLFFLVILAVANALIFSINNPVYTEIVLFVNKNIFLFFIIAVIGILNDIFWTFYFPFNIIAPITSSLLSIYIIMFLEKLFDFFNVQEITNISIPFTDLYILVALIVLVAGYLVIAIRAGRPRGYFEKISRERQIKQKEARMDRRERRKEELEEIKELNKEVRDIEWEDIGDEFKQALFNLGKSINNLFEEKESKVKVKKKRRK